jgi:hypothetical protein
VLAGLLGLGILSSVTNALMRSRTVVAMMVYFKVFSQMLPSLKMLGWKKSSGLSSRKIGCCCG